VAPQDAVVSRPFAAFGVQNSVHFRNRNRSVEPSQRAWLYAGQTAEIGYDIAAFPGARLEGRHVRCFLGCDLLVLLVRQKMQAPIKSLQFEIVFRAPASETAQSLTISQLDVYDAPCLIRTEGPTRAGGRGVDTHLRGRVVEHQLQFPDGRLPANVRQIRP